MLCRWVWSSVLAWSGKRTLQNEGMLYASRDITSHEPEIIVFEEGAVPKSAKQARDGWFSRNKCYVVGGLVVVAGAAGAASASGGGSGGSDRNRDADVEVTW
jgi:hypothetical protein